MLKKMNSTVSASLGKYFYRQHFFTKAYQNSEGEWQMNYTTDKNHPERADCSATAGSNFINLFEFRFSIDKDLTIDCAVDSDHRSDHSRFGFHRTVYFLQCEFLMRSIVLKHCSGQGERNDRRARHSAMKFRDDLFTHFSVKIEP